MSGVSLTGYWCEQLDHTIHKDSACWMEAHPSGQEYSGRMCFGSRHCQHIFLKDGWLLQGAHECLLNNISAHLQERAAVQVWSQQLAGGHGKVFLGTTGLWELCYRMGLGIVAWLRCQRCVTLPWDRAFQTLWKLPGPLLFLISVPAKKKWSGKVVFIYSLDAFLPNRKIVMFNLPVKKKNCSPQIGKGLVIEATRLS